MSYLFLSKNLLSFKKIFLLNYEGSTMTKYTKYIDQYDKNKFIQEQDDYIIAKGGDGTLLRAIKMFLHTKKPFFGIASGSVNFLMNKEDKILENSIIKSFHMIKADITFINDNGNEEITTVQGFNDICIGGSDGLAAMLYFDIEDEDKALGKFGGGGLIFSTAQGSTAVNVNNYGVVLPLSSKDWSITGDKTNKHIRLVLNPQKININVQSRCEVIVWVDGLSGYVIRNVQKLTISQGDTVDVIFNNFDEFQIKRRNIS